MEGNEREAYEGERREGEEREGLVRGERRRAAGDVGCV